LGEDIDSAFGRKKEMPASFREKVLLKVSIYHIVVFVNNKCMGWGNYENCAVVRENLTYLASITTLRFLQI